jgi:hypothetical protein
MAAMPPTAKGRGLDRTRGRSELVIATKGRNDVLGRTKRLSSDVVDDGEIVTTMSDGLKTI